MFKIKIIDMNYFGIKASLIFFVLSYKSLYVSQIVKEMNHER